MAGDVREVHVRDAVVRQHLREVAAHLAAGDRAGVDLQAAGGARDVWNQSAVDLRGEFQFRREAGLFGLQADVLVGLASDEHDEEEVAGGHAQDRAEPFDADTGSADRERAGVLGREHGDDRDLQERRQGEEFRAEHAEAGPDDGREPGDDGPEEERPQRASGVRSEIARTMTGANMRKTPVIRNAASPGRMRPTESRSCLDGAGIAVQRIRSGCATQGPVRRSTSGSPAKSRSASGRRSRSSNRSMDVVITNTCSSVPVRRGTGERMRHAPQIGAHGALARLRRYRGAART